MSSGEDTLPAPLTTLDDDVRDLDSFMLNVSALMASELWAISTGEEFKAAVALWCRAWQQRPAGSIPTSDKVLSGFAGVSPARWKAIKAVALRGFVLCSDGRLYHSKLCEDVKRAAEKKRAFVKRAKSGAQARWKDACSNASSIPEAMLNDAHGQGQGHIQGARAGLEPKPKTPEPARNDVEQAFGAAGIDVGDPFAGVIPIDPAKPLNLGRPALARDDVAGVVKRTEIAHKMNGKAGRLLATLIDTFGVERTESAIRDAIDHKATAPVSWAETALNGAAAEYAQKVAKAKTSTAITSTRMDD